MSVADRVFVDTNVLLYSCDPRDPAKQAAATEWLNLLWEHGNGSLSWQVLHEFYVNAVRKLGIAAPGARNLVEVFAAWQPIGNSLGLIQRAWHWMDTAKISYWDALIVAAAERSGCSVLLSEDFQIGRTFGDVKVFSPFVSAPFLRLRGE